MRTTANAILHLGLVCPDVTSSSNQEIKSKITTVQKTVQIIDYVDVKVQKKLDETTVDLKEYAKFSDNATRDRYIAKTKMLRHGDEDDEAGGVEGGEAQE